MKSYFGFKKGMRVKITARDNQNHNKIVTLVNRYDPTGYRDEHEAWYYVCDDKDTEEAILGRCLKREKIDNWRKEL